MSKAFCVRVYYTLAVRRFKPFLSGGLLVHSYLSGAYTVQNVLAVVVLRKKNESSLRSRKTKPWQFAECVVSFAGVVWSRCVTRPNIDCEGDYGMCDPL